MVDRLADWNAAIEAACRSNQLDNDAVNRVKAGLILKPVKGISPFSRAADEVQASISGLRTFIDENKRDYVAASGRFSSQQKDKIEEEVLQVVSTCRARLEQLTNSIVAAQQQRGPGGRPLVNEEAVAHLHGTVLVLVELLHRASGAFDRCRSVRNAQQIADDMRLRQRRTAQYSAGTSARSQRHGAGGLLGTEPANDGSNEQDWPGQQHPRQQQQQQVMADQETQQLLDDLMRSTNQVERVERTVREITTMQQMISTAVMQQAEAIEQLYNVAVEATTNIRRGNEDLKKTIAVNSSSTRYIVVLLLTASAMLLLFDWINS